MMCYQKLKNYNKCKRTFYGLLALLFCSVFITLTCLGAALPLYPFHSSSQTAQFDRLTQQLRCLVCQNENLADSQSAFAENIRHQIYKMVKQGQTGPSIKQYLVERYGDFILYKPPLNDLTLLLWLMPFILLVGGGWIFYKIVRNTKRKRD